MRFLVKYFHYLSLVNVESHRGLDIVGSGSLFVILRLRFETFCLVK